MILTRSLILWALLTTTAPAEEPAAEPIPSCARFASASKALKVELEKLVALAKSVGGKFVTIATEHLHTHEPPKPARNTTRPTRVMDFWQPNVKFVADPTRPGARTAGLSCRMWLFDESVGHPMYCDGSLTVDLYDCSPGPNGEPASKHLEQWQFKPGTLNQFKKVDILGDGYTVFLPWGSYRPNVTRVRMKLRFDPADGGPALVSEPTTITLGSTVGVPKELTGGSPER